MTKLHGILTIHCQEQFINKLNNDNLHTKLQRVQILPVVPGSFFPCDRRHFFSPWLAVVGETLFVADFYHWISGGILHDGFEAVMKTQLQVST